MDQRLNTASTDAQHDRWLAEVAAGGAERDPAAKQLHRAFQPKFLAAMRHHGIPPDMANDALQEAWLAIFRKAGEIRPGTSAAAFLWGFASLAREDAMRKWMRRRGREVSDSQDVDTGEVEQSLALLGGPTPETSRQLADLRQCVARAFAAFKQLHATEAWLLYARHVEGWDLPQIAECRQSSEHAAAEFLSKARIKFRPLVRTCLELRFG